MPSLRFLLLHEESPGRRLHAHDREERRRHPEALHALRLVAADQVRVPPVHRRQLLERIGLRADVEEVGRRYGALAVDVVVARVGEHHQAVDVRDREGTQRERVDHAEHGGVRAEPERERQHDRGADRGPLDDGAERVPELEAERAHGRVSLA